MASKESKMLRTEIPVDNDSTDFEKNDVTRSMKLYFGEALRGGTHASKAGKRLKARQKQTIILISIIQPKSITGLMLLTISEEKATPVVSAV